MLPIHPPIDIDKNDPLDPFDSQIIEISLLDISTFSRATGITTTTPVFLSGFP